MRNNRALVFLLITGAILIASLGMLAIPRGSPGSANFTSVWAYPYPYPAPEPAEQLVHLPFIARFEPSNRTIDPT